jgi:hypothetical protein
VPAKVFQLLMLKKQRNRGNFRVKIGHIIVLLGDLMTNPQPSFRNPGIPFDPLQYVKRLEAVGFTREQAETQAETFLSIVQEQLVTKQDLKESETQLTTHIKEVEARMKEVEAQLTTHIKEVEAQLTTHIKEIEAQLTTHIKEVEAQLTNRMKEIEAQLTNRMKELEIKTTLKIEVLKRDLKIWFGGMLVGLVVVMSGIMTLIVHLGGH